MSNSTSAPQTETQISTTQCRLILVAGFLGWLLAGMQLAVSSIVMRDALRGLMQSVEEATIAQWFGWLTSSFMLGAAAGGYILGWVGDKTGRKRAMALSITVYALFGGLSFFVQSPGQLLLMRFVIGFGVGGMWPNGIALVSEAWPNMSRPMLSGVIGTAANVGIMLFAIMAWIFPVTAEQWRWVMAASITPVFLAVFVILFVPESPKWLVLQQAASSPTNDHDQKSPLVEIFSGPLIKTTLIGIALGTIPLFGGWGSSNWANAWASQVGEQGAQSQSVEAEDQTPQRPDPALKARVLLSRALPGSIASLLGGALATVLGRRFCYFFLSLACLICAQYLFWFTHPSRETEFLIWYAALGLFSGFFFGWLPLCLPELFPTRVRSTGAGVSFNFGRIATAFGILVAAGLLKVTFDGNYAHIGRLTSLIYLFGMVVIWFAPDTTEQGLDD